MVHSVPGVRPAVGFVRPRLHTPPLTALEAANFVRIFATYLIAPNYGGPLGRLYRFSDGAEREDLTYPDIVTGMVNADKVNEWAGADGCGWCRRYCQVTPGAYQEQSSVAHMPVFDPVDGTMDCDRADGVVRFLAETGLSIAQPYTLFEMFIRTGGSAVAQTLLNLVAANTPGGLGTDGTSNDLAIYKPATTTTGTPGTWARRNSWQTFSVVSNGATSYYCHNFVEGNWTGPSTTDAHTIDTIASGGKPGADSSRFRGRIAVTAIAGVAMTREQQRAIVHRLNLMKGRSFAGLIGGGSTWGFGVARALDAAEGRILALLQNPADANERIYLRSDWRGFADDGVGEYCDGWLARELHFAYGGHIARQTDAAKMAVFNWGGGANGTKSGFNCLTFDGVDDTYVTDSFALAALNPICPMVLLKAHASPPAHDQWLFGQGVTATDGVGLMLRANSAAEGWQTGDLMLCGDGYQSGQTARWIMTNAQGVMDGTWRSFGGRRGSSDTNFYAYSSGGATLMAVRSENNAAIQAITAPLHIGSLDGTQGFFKGDLVEAKLGQDSTQDSATTGWGNLIAHQGGLGGRDYS